MTDPRISRTGTLRLDAFAADIIDDRGFLVGSLTDYTPEAAEAFALRNRRVTITIEPADAPVHGSPFDYLSALKAQLEIAHQDAIAISPQSRAIERAIQLANSAHLAILSERARR